MNCGTLWTAGAHLIPTRNKGLLHYLPHRNLDVCSCSRLSHRAYGVLRAPLGQDKRAHREKQRWGRLFLYQQLVVWWRNLHSIKSFCSPDLEFHMLLCRPFWLPREFTAIIITAVYIPLQANTDQALKELYGNISEQETAYPDAAFIVTRDFNKANFRTIAPKYFQHITITRVVIVYWTTATLLYRDAYKSLSRPPFGKSDHSSVLLLSAYRQKLKREAPALRTIQCWSDQSEAILQDCFDHVDWDMFQAASDDDIEAYSDTVTCFIRKCVEDVVPTKTICIYPNQKPWINSDVRAALSARTSAFKSGNFDDRKQASYDLRKSIKASNDNIKTKLKNNSTPTTQEACGRHQ